MEENSEVETPETTDAEEGLLADIQNPTDGVQPTAELTQDEVIEQLDIHLRRIFQVGEILPWKGIVFRVSGIRGGMVGLVVERIRNQAPKSKTGRQRAARSKIARHKRKNK